MSRFQMLLSCEPPMYGRLDAGQTVTTATHQPAATSVVTPRTMLCQSRRRNDVGAASRYTSASTGRITNACSILARNAKPTKTPAHAIHLVDDDSSARTTA